MPIQGDWNNLKLAQEEGRAEVAVWVFESIETCLKQKGGRLLAGSRVVVLSGGGFMAWVWEQEEHREGLVLR